jgi:hypothetical protein
MKENDPTSSPVGRGLRTRRKPKASDTPETDAQRITDLNVAMRLDASGHWTGDTNVEVVSAEFARGLERDRNHMSKAAVEWMRSWREIHDRVTQAEVAAEEAQEERDEARNLADAAMWEADRLRPRAPVSCPPSPDS